MERENRNLKVLVVILCILVLGLGGYFFYDKVLSDDGNDNIKDNINDTQNDDVNENNDLNNNTNNNEEDTMLKDIKEIFEFVYNYYVPSFVFCGKNEMTNKMPENGNGLPYSVSLDFESYDEMLSYLKKYMSQEVISKKQAFASTDKNWYYEYDGKLFCENTGKGNMYGIENIDIEIISQNENKIIAAATVELIDPSDNKKYEKVNITLDKINDNWIITSYNTDE